MAASILAPFERRDFTLLYAINICEFLATTLSRLAALQFLYEATGSGRALALLGVVTLICQIPSIALGGVLADTFPRALLVSRIQTAAALVATLRWLLCACGGLSPFLIYLTVGMLEVTSRLESSARASILASVVPKAALPNAVTVVQLTQFFGEILAPWLFWLLADSGGGGGGGSAIVNATAGNSTMGASIPFSATQGLSWPFLAAALSFVPCAVLPRSITTDTTPGGIPKVDGQGSGSAPSSSLVATVTRAWLAGLKSMVEGVRYIFNHPLLPGLYALDWGFTCVSFYRELVTCSSGPQAQALRHHAPRGLEALPLLHMAAHAICRRGACLKGQR